MRMQSLISNLDMLESHLRSVGEKFWADKIKSILRNDDESLSTYQLDEILSWYGGMGSFSDLVISELNGHSITEKDEDHLNDELSKIRSRIYKDTVSLRKSFSC